MWKMDDKTYVEQIKAAFIEAWRRSVMWEERKKMTRRITLKTVDDLIKYLSNPELKGRPLCQVITVTVNMGGAGADLRRVYLRRVYFNQLDNFTWNADNNELEVEV